LFSGIAIAITVALYFLFVRKQAQRHWPDVRKGLFIFLTEVAIKIASRLPYHPKIWKPNLLVPVENPRDWVGMVDCLRAIAYPKGRIDFFSVVSSESAEQTEEEKKKREEDFSLITEPLKEEGLLATARIVEAAHIKEGALVVTQTVVGSVLSPNVLFVKLGVEPQKDEMLKSIVEKGQSLGLGTLVFRLNPKSAFGQKQKVNLWIKQGSPNIHLAILISLQLEKNWEAKLRIVQVVDEEKQKAQAEEYLQKLKRLMRISKEAEIHVAIGTFEGALLEVPQADINIFGMAEEVNFALIRSVSDKICTSVLFLRDSEHEKAVV